MLKLDIFFLLVMGVKLPSFSDYSTVA